MKPIDFKESNIIMGRPEGMTEEECGDMAMAKSHTPSGENVFISCWEISQEELQTLNQTKLIWVWQFGDHVQPIALDLQHPFKEPQPLMERWAVQGGGLFCFYTSEELARTNHPDAKIIHLREVR